MDEINLFCTKPTIKDIQKAEPLYLIFDKYISYLLDELTAEKALWLAESCGVDACKTTEVAGQILRLAREAKSIRNNYEIRTDGLTFRIKKHYINWAGTKTWKWITDRREDILQLNKIIDVQNIISDCVKEDMAKKYGWRKIII